VAVIPKLPKGKKPAFFMGNVSLRQESNLVPDTSGTAKKNRKTSDQKRFEQRMNTDTGREQGSSDCLDFKSSLFFSCVHPVHLRFDFSEMRA